MLHNPFWYALYTEHAGLAVGSGLARRYPAEVLPFGAVERGDAEGLRALAELLEPGETVFLASGGLASGGLASGGVAGGGVASGGVASGGVASGGVTGDGLPEVPELELVSELPGLQMVFPREALGGPERDEVRIEALGVADAERMVALKALAFPGYFGRRTVELGGYVGIFAEGELVAMAGHRVSLPGMREISALCTHPAHTGKGYGAALVRHLLREHAGAGLRSFLHVAGANERAIGLYERLGFLPSRTMLFSELRRRVRVRGGASAEA